MGFWGFGVLGFWVFLVIFGYFGYFWLLLVCLSPKKGAYKEKNSLEFCKHVLGVIVQVSLEQFDLFIIFIFQKYLAK